MIQANTDQSAVIAKPHARLRGSGSRFRSMPSVQGVRHEHYASSP